VSAEAKLAQDAGAVYQAPGAVIRLEQLLAHDAFLERDVVEQRLFAE